MKGLLNTAIDYMLTTERTEITQVELLELVAEKCNNKKDHVRGAVIGYAPNKLFGNQKIQEKWVKLRRQGSIAARFVRKTDKEIEKAFGLTYETESKEKAREFVFSNVLESKKQKLSVLTMAGHEGGCVKHVLAHKPKSKIVNVEKDARVLATFKALGINTENHNMDMSTFLANDTRTFDMIFYDSVYGLCQYIAGDMMLINNTKKAKYLVITLLNIKRFRNHGTFIERMRDLYYQYEDPTLTWFKQNLTNYNFIEEFVYNRDAQSGSRAMRVLKFKLK